MAANALGPIADASGAELDALQPLEGRDDTALEVGGPAGAALSAGPTATEPGGDGTEIVGAGSSEGNDTADAVTGAATGFGTDTLSTVGNDATGVVTGRATGSGFLVGTGADTVFGTRGRAGSLGTGATPVAASTTVSAVAVAVWVARDDFAASVAGVVVADAVAAVSRRTVVAVLVAAPAAAAPTADEADVNGCNDEADALGARPSSDVDETMTVTSTSFQRAIRIRSFPRAHEVTNPI